MSRVFRIVLTGGPCLRLLEAEIDDGSRELVLPPFVEIERDVTGESEFTNFAIAAR